MKETDKPKRPPRTEPSAISADVRSDSPASAAVGPA